MTSADQTTRPDRRRRRRLRRLIWPAQTNRRHRPKRPIQTKPDDPAQTTQPDRAAPAADQQTTRPAAYSTKVWSAIRGRLAARQTKPDRAPQTISAGGFAHLLLLVFGLVLLGVIAGAFLVGYFNVVDTLVRVVHVGDSTVVVAAAGIPRTFVDPAAPIPTLAYIGAGVIEAASTLTAIATVLLRAAPWRVRAYAWLMFLGVLSASVWAGIEHANNRGYESTAGWFSGLWPLLVASCVHLFTVVRRWVFDPVAQARRVTVQTSAAPAQADRQTRPAAAAPAKPAPPHRVQTTAVQPLPDQTTLAPVREIADDQQDQTALKAIRAAHQTGSPSLGQIKSALKKAGQTCGQTKAIRLRGLLEQTDEADPDRAAAATN